MAVPGRNVSGQAPAALAGSELFSVDAYLREFDATVPRWTASTAGSHCAVPAFYPGGGGQPHDLGTLRWADGQGAVTRVGRDRGKIWHWLEADELPATGAEVHGRAGLGAPAPDHAHPHSAAHPLRRDLDRPPGRGDRRQHGPGQGPARLPAAVDVGRVRPAGRAPDQRGDRGRAPDPRRVRRARGGRRGRRADPDRGPPDPTRHRPAAGDRHRRPRQDRPTAAPTC